VFQNVGI